MNRFRWVRTVGAIGSCATLAGCASLRHADDPWWGEDKAKHFAVCGLAGAAAALAARNNGGSDGSAFWVGMGVSVGLGAGKETYDARVKGTYFSGKDFVWDLLGGLVGGGLAVGLQE